MSIPIVAMTGVVGGFQKPKSLFFATIGVFFAGLVLSVEAGVGVFIGGLVFVFNYGRFFIFLKRKCLCLFKMEGMFLWGLTFKRSIIENVPVDIDKVNEAIFFNKPKSS